MIERKVLLSSAVLAVAALGLSSCGMKEDDHGILKVSNTKATVNYTNNESDIHRGFVTTTTPHRAATAVFTIDTKASTANPGNLGFLFDVEEIKASEHKKANDGAGDGIEVDTYNFGNVTVSYSESVAGTKKAGINVYVSYYTGVATKNAEGENLLDGGNNFKDAKGDVISKTASSVGAKETEYIETWTSLSSIKADADGLIKVAAVITPKAPATDDANGSYSVVFYDASNITENGSKKDSSTWVSTDAKPLIGEVSVPASWTAKKDTKEESLPQSLIGYYSAVRADNTLVGNITLPYIQAEADVIEWDEVQY